MHPASIAFRRLGATITRTQSLPIDVWIGAKVPIEANLYRLSAMNTLGRTFRFEGGKNEDGNDTIRSGDGP